MQQLILDIRPHTPKRFDNFVVGDNAEVVARLQAAGRAEAADLLYLYGPPGSGRSHLLEATRRDAARPTLRLSANAAGDFSAEAGTLLLIDDIEQLDEAAQIALFRCFNAAQRDRLALVLAGSEAPLRLPLREDLRTRVGATLMFEIKPLSDADKARTLLEQARARGMMVDAQLVDYLLRHGRRDLPSLLALLDALDAASLERKRPVTLSLLRELMQDSLPI
ncbi:MAG: DnaA regulatory inactivator Hda [Sterolibacteriaceae bacterium]|nr:DnaA regulatory inactivator Hda [Sterolibacteriaceae bacterium]MBK9085739.1 DnaA regulatory inactivator Hda [Sterolibacteriaceae bacterium]